MSRRSALALGVALSVAVPSVALAAGETSSDQPVVLVKKRSSSSESAGGRGWMDYLKMSFTLSKEEVAQPIKDGRLLEHIVGGLFSSLGGHIWGPMIFYKDVKPDNNEAMIIGVISTLVGWSWLPIVLIAWIPYVGWAVGAVLWVTWIAVDLTLQLWFFPRALQFAYSDAAGGGGGSDAPQAPAVDAPPSR